MGRKRHRHQNHGSGTAAAKSSMSGDVATHARPPAAQSGMSVDVDTHAAMSRDSAVAATNSGTGGFMLLGNNGWQSAGQSGARGYIYWPQLDTRRQLTRFTREEITRRLDWLWNHFGFARRLVNGMARMLGFQVPQPNTSDEPWNEAAYETFMGIAGSAEIWDRAAKFDFFQGQVQDNITCFRSGDQVAVLTETLSGRARLAYYEAHQIRTGDRDDPHWVDGVLLDAAGKHIGYGLQDGEDPTLNSFVSARDAIYFGNFENRGQVRPLSILHAAVLNMIDVVEVRGFLKEKIKNSSRTGHVIEKDLATVMSGVGGAGGPVVRMEQPMPDGTTQLVDMEVVYKGGVAPNLPPGAKLRTISDDNPSQNNMEFEKALLRDCCDAVDLSYDRMANLAGITGPGIRILNADEKRWVALRHYPMAKRNQRQWNYTIAKEIKAGRLKPPSLKPGEFWWNRVQWIGLADPDIDAGNTAAATITDLQSGQTTWLRQLGVRGLYWKRGIGQAIDEVIWAELECIERSKKAGLPPGRVTPERVFPLRFAIQNVQPTVAADPTKVNLQEKPADSDDPIEVPT